MKDRMLTFTVVLCVAGLVASGAFADKPDKPPGKPANPGTTTDLIIFEGDLDGHAIVEGCCPNAGPNPPYTMTVTRDLGYDGGPQVPADTYSGHIFMNYFGTRKNQQYYIKFWGSSSTKQGLNVAFGIKGGMIYREKKNRSLTVEFVAEDLYTLGSDGVLEEYIDAVTFTLKRTEL
jgi:hypothetical protein